MSKNKKEWLIVGSVFFIIVYTLEIFNIKLNYKPAEIIKIKENILYLNNGEKINCFTKNFKKNEKIFYSKTSIVKRLYSDLPGLQFVPRMYSVQVGSR